MKINTKLKFRFLIWLFVKGASCATETFFFKTHRAGLNMELLEDLRAHSVLDCARRCASRDDCRVEAYQAGTGNCLIGSRNVTWNSATGQSFNGEDWEVYFKEVLVEIDENVPNANPSEASPSEANPSDANPTDASPSEEPVENGDWTYFSNSYYSVFATFLNWTDSRDACAFRDAHLATLTSGEENAFVTSLVNTTLRNNLTKFQQKMKYTWLGASDFEEEGVFEWVTGEPWTFDNWGQYEPSNNAALEHCLAYFPVDDEYITSIAGTWNDGYCSEQHAFVCEKDM